MTSQPPLHRQQCLSRCAGVQSGTVSLGQGSNRTCSAAGAVSHTVDDVTLAISAECACPLGNSGISSYPKPSTRSQWELIGLSTAVCAIRRFACALVKAADHRSRITVDCARGLPRTDAAWAAAYANVASSCIAVAGSVGKDTNNAHGTQRAVDKFSMKSSHSYEGVVRTCSGRGMAATQLCDTRRRISMKPASAAV
jgi:hypothetical protein